MDTRVLRSAFADGVKWGLFPAVLCGAIAMIYMAPGLGMKAQQAQMAAFFATVALIVAVERWLPANRAWLRAVGRDRWVDATSFVVLMAAVDPLTRALAAMILTGLVIHVGNVSPLNVFPNDIPFLAQLALATLVAEFGQYWMHRFAHERKILWRFHAVHHSAERIYWLNGFRVHPLNMMWHFFAGTFVLMLLGANERVLVAYLTVSSIVSAFQHANIDLKFGVLNYIFSTNELHRWHHSTRLDEGNRNYGGVLILWDLLFRTRYLVTDTQPQRLGLADKAGYPFESYGAQLLHSFRRKGKA